MMACNFFILNHTYHFVSWTAACWAIIFKKLVCFAAAKWYHSLNLTFSSTRVIAALAGLVWKPLPPQRQLLTFFFFKKGVYYSHSALISMGFKNPCLLPLANQCLWREQGRSRSFSARAKHNQLLVRQVRTQHPPYQYQLISVSAAVPIS